MLVHEAESDMKHEKPSYC